MADTNKRHLGGQRLMNQVSGAMRASGGSGLGGLSGFMGLPIFSRGSDHLGSYAGHGQMLSPFNNYGFGSLGGYGGHIRKPAGPQIEDPPLPPVDPNDPNGNGGGGTTSSSGWSPINLMYPPPIGTGAQWRNTMKYGA